MEHQFWRDRWQQNNTPWDLKMEHPSISKLFSEILKLKSFSNQERIWVPGCGQGHDAAWFANQGFQVIGSDFVPEAIEAAQAAYSQLVKFQCENVLTTEKYFDYPFELVFDRAMLCALDPSQRKQYIGVIYHSLAKYGIFAGITFLEREVENPSRPPFDISLPQLHELLSPGFTLLFAFEEKAESIESPVIKKILLSGWLKSEVMSAY